MIIDKFRFENNDYVIDLQYNNSMVFYREAPDLFSWFSDPIVVTEVTNDIHNPLKLLRMIAEKMKHFLYDKKVPYFYLTVEGDKRKWLYMKFLDKLSGYHYQVSNDTINAFKDKG